jgi:hypothetical protein
VEFLSIWVGNMNMNMNMNMNDRLDPDVIIVGGGVSGMLTPFFADIGKRVPRWCVNSRAQQIPLAKAR